MSLILMIEKSWRERGGLSTKGSSVRNFLIVFLYILVGPIWAKPEDRNRCHEDLNKLCSHAKGIAEKLECLKKNDKQLSVACRKQIQRSFKTEIQTKAPTGMLFSGAGGLGGRLSFIPLVKYQTEISGPVGQPKNNSDTRITRHTLEGSTPLYGSKKGILSASVRYGVTQFNRELTLNSGTKINSHLKKLEFGLNFNKPLDNRKNFNIRAQYGYRGDKIGGSDYNYSLMTGYSYPTESKKGRWQYFLMFSNNGPLGNNIPIPGFMYFYRTPTMNLIVGLPVLSLQWNPEKSDFGVSASLFGPFYNLELTYGLVDEIQYFAFTRWKQENFILSDRTSKRDRLNIYEKITGVGLRAALMDKNLGLELRAGFSNDRKLYMGNGLFKKNKGSLDLRDSSFVKLLISKAFR